MPSILLKKLGFDRVPFRYGGVCPDSKSGQTLQTFTFKGVDAHGDPTKKEFPEN